MLVYGTLAKRQCAAFSLQVLKLLNLAALKAAPGLPTNHSRVKLYSRRLLGVLGGGDAAHCSILGVKSGRRVWTILGRGGRGLSSWSLSSGAELLSPPPLPCSSSHTCTTTLGVVGVAVWSSYFSPEIGAQEVTDLMH